MFECSIWNSAGNSRGIEGRGISNTKFSSETQSGTDYLERLMLRKKIILK
jgi:hypothetical protein